MQGLSKVLKPNVTIPEYGYGVITASSIIVYNGELGCRYTPRSRTLIDLAEHHGTFAIPDMKDFQAKQRVLDSIESVSIQENTQTLEVLFGKNSKVSFPIILNIGENYPHTTIPWVDYAANKEFIPITQAFREMASLLSNEGSMLWQDDIGITIDGEKMLSFDLGVCLTSTLSDNTQKVFVPKRLLDTSLPGLSRIVKVQGGLILCNEEYQYYTPIKDHTSIPPEVAELVDNFEKGERKKLVLTLSSTFWRRVSTFSKNQLNLSIKNKIMVASSGTWSEQLGMLDIDDCELTVSTSLMQRWMKGCLNHALSIDSSGHWLLRGDLRHGGNFYATTTLNTASAVMHDEAGSDFDIMGDDVSKNLGQQTPGADVVDIEQEQQDEQDLLAGGLL